MGNQKKAKFYAVHKGHNPGVYTTYAEVLEQITGFQRNSHKSFSTKEEAEYFVERGHERPKTPPTTGEPIVH
ncbi:hypothetical protein K505DRAFT_322177 [Melanomma pulvis-pyrius CBS 109.77]|uniref:ribonuclease H n=1 Tax=Melanomma pulvis-pyrius CBS 109.77 TaxID=1314802 RepID=A0A6A6XNU0_9PLEO|nr:hypothetical protein K505DRAFT_322177 [Melanomma pulvis-pyrius CBS 109.77]